MFSNRIGDSSLRSMFDETRRPAMNNELAAGGKGMEKK